MDKETQQRVAKLRESFEAVKELYEYAKSIGALEPDEDDNPFDGRYCPACGEHLGEGHVCAEIDVLAQAAWNDYKSGICPCGNAECGGIEWLSDGNDPFERLEVEL